MADPASPKQTSTRLRPAKREAIEHAGLRVFARLGYTRASIDLISEEAGVSTRTIYNHFENKLGLFSAVLLASATVSPTLSSSKSTPASRAPTRE